MGLASELAPANLVTDPALPAAGGGAAALPDPSVMVPWLICDVALEIPVAHFTVRDLLNLRKGSIVETTCHHTRDLPLRANGQLICWTEFEVIGNKLAVRITESA
jgi:flagellar motor switch/type III secretory pathway protein FliN